MLSRNIVLHSVNSCDQSQCVDVFVREDGTYGFEQFRRDFEDIHGWQPMGGFRDFVFLSEKKAFEAALNNVVWLVNATDLKLADS